MHKSTLVSHRRSQQKQHYCWWLLIALLWRSVFKLGEYCVKMAIFKVPPQSVVRCINQPFAIVVPSYMNEKQHGIHINKEHVLLQ